MAPLLSVDTVSLPTQGDLSEMEELTDSGEGGNQTTDVRARPELFDCVYVHDAPTFAVIKRHGRITNAAELRYNPGNPRKPFIIKLDLTGIYRTHHTSRDGTNK